LVLDDYQFTTGDGCRESMDFFVEHLPENVHLILATRSDPPLHLGRLRARGELSEIRTEQLAFSEEEAAFLLNDTPLRFRQYRKDARQVHLSQARGLLT